MQTDWKNVNLKRNYGQFRSPLYRASDRSATVLTVLVYRTIKKSSSPIGPGFESQLRRQKGHWSITLLFIKKDLSLLSVPSMQLLLYCCLARDKSFLFCLERLRRRRTRSSAKLGGLTKKNWKKGSQGSSNGSLIRFAVASLDSLVLKYPQSWR